MPNQYNETYIALLRGINVGGHRPLKMAYLRQMFVMMGFENVSTYIQSGNVIFDAPVKSQDVLSGDIHHQIEQTFGYDVPVIVQPAEELKTIIEHFPFDEKEGWKGYITFLSDQPDKEKQKRLESHSNETETFLVRGKVVYAQVDKQTNQKPAFSTNFIQKQTGLTATNRNLRSVNKILEIALK